MLFHYRVFFFFFLPPIDQRGNFKEKVIQVELNRKRITLQVDQQVEIAFL